MTGNRPVWDAEAYQAEKREKAKAFSRLGNRTVAGHAAVKVESVADRKAREDRERHEALLRSAAKVAPTLAVVEADGTIVPLAPDAAEQIAAAFKAASGKRAASSGGARRKGEPVTLATDARGIVLPTGHNSAPLVSDTEAAIDALTLSLRGEIQAGKLSADDGRAILASAKREAATMGRAMTRCRSRLAGDCPGKVCQRCGGKGWLALAVGPVAPQFVDAFPVDEPTARVTLHPVAPGEPCLTVPHVKGDVVDAAARHLLSDAKWSHATIALPSGAPIVVACYYHEDGTIVADEAGAPMRTIHESEGAALLAATAWTATNAGRVSVGLTRSDAWRGHTERERRPAARKLSAPLAKLAEKHGPEAVPVDDPRRASMRRDGCVIKVPARVGPNATVWKLP